MYQKAGATITAATTGGLAYTGVNVLWMLLAGFAFIAAGSALLRIVPKTAKHPVDPTQ